MNGINLARTHFAAYLAWLKGLMSYTSVCLAAALPGYVPLAHPCGLKIRLVEGGFCASLSDGRRGLATSSPPQFGQVPPSIDSAHVAQKVHSKEQMRASVDSGGKSRSQHSQPGRNSSMRFPLSFDRLTRIVTSGNGRILRVGIKCQTKRSSITTGSLYSSGCSQTPYTGASSSSMTYWRPPSQR